MGTHRVTVEIADNSYQLLRRAVESGQYRSESEAVEDVLTALCLEPIVHEGPEFEQWLREDALAADDELEADPSSGLTTEQLRSSLAQARLAHR
jgi:Arc/MetJ-type ribon-helix-helix transcriptional regulator